MDSTKKKLLIISGIIIFLVFIGLVIFSLLQHRGETKITVVVAPQDSTITLDGQPVEASEIYVKNGEHTLKASRQYFTDAIKAFNTEDIEPGETIYLLPGADSPEARQWLRDHPDEVMFREHVGGAQAEQSAQEYTKNYPILEDLPHRTLDYKIDYATENGQVTFTVTLYPVATTPGTPEYRQQLAGFKADALTYMESQGLNPDEEEITFTPDPDNL